MALRLTNQYHRPLHVAVYSLGCDYSIKLLYPSQGVDRPIDPGRSLLHGARETEADRQAFRFSLPVGWPEQTEYIKLVASTRKAEFGLLKQDGLRSLYERTREARRQPTSELEALLAAAAVGGRPVAVEAEDDKEIEHWGTVTIPYRLIP